MYKNWQIVDWTYQFKKKDMAWPWHREVNEVTMFVVHHSATPQVAGETDRQRIQKLANVHIARNSAKETWPGVSYHYVITTESAKQGIIYKLNQHTDVTWCAVNAVHRPNEFGVHLCVDGYFHPGYNEQPIPEVLEGIQWLHWFLKNTDTNLKFPNLGNTIYGHRNFQATSCPGNLLYPYIESMNGGAKYWSVPDPVIAPLPEVIAPTNPESATTPTTVVDPSAIVVIEQPTEVSNTDDTNVIDESLIAMIGSLEATKQTLTNKPETAQELDKVEQMLKGALELNKSLKGIYKKAEMERKTFGGKLKSALSQLKNPIFLLRIVQIIFATLAAYNLVPPTLATGVDKVADTTKLFTGIDPNSFNTNVFDGIWSAIVVGVVEPVVRWYKERKNQ